MVMHVHKNQMISSIICSYLHSGTFDFCTLVKASWQNWLCATLNSPQMTEEPTNHLSWSSCAGSPVPRLLVAPEEEATPGSSHSRCECVQGCQMGARITHACTHAHTQTHIHAHTHTCAHLDSISTSPHHRRPFFSLTPDNLWRYPPTPRLSPCSSIPFPCPHQTRWL